MSGPIIVRLFTYAGLAVLACGGFGYAASIAGEVYDVRSGAVVPGATVTVNGEPSVTGADGSYKVVAVPAGRRHLLARAAGYAVTVIEGFYIAEDGDNWYNVPLMPLTTASDYRGDFLELFYRRAPLEEITPGSFRARRLGAPPAPVTVKGGSAADESRVAALVLELNERWGTSIFEMVGAEGTAGGVTLSFGAPRVSFDLGPAPAAFFEGGAGDDNLDLAAAFLRRLALGGGEAAGPVSADELAADNGLASDLDRVVEIIYRERPDFDYGIFRRRVPARLSVLTDLYLGIGGYSRHGIIDERGGPAEFPRDYQLGMLNLAGGLAYRGVWARAGWWFAGIWGPDAETAYSPDHPAAKILRRNSSVYYRLGYGLRAGPPVRLSPFGGYRQFRVRGKFEGSEFSPTGARPLALDYTSRYDGYETGVRGEVVLPWYDIGMFVEYARVFARERYNLAEAGGGAVNRVGVGTFVFGRVYWGRPFKYVFGGLAMTLDIPL